MNKLAIAFLIITISLTSFSQSGNLDLSFGIAGKVTTAVGNGNDVGSAIAVQSDGKIVVTGNTYNGTNFDIVVLRYNTNGTLDNTFGTSGKVTTAIGSGTETGNAVAVQTDGKIIVAGYSYTGTNADFAVVRYNANGTLDNTFGTLGKVVTPIGSAADIAYGMVLQADGKIVLVGNSLNGTNSDFALVRYTTTGVLDATFGTGGKVTTPVGSSSDYAYSVLVQPDGKLIAGGWSNDGFNINFALVRYTINGGLDNSFGTAGIATATGGGADNYGRCIALQADGKVVMTGDVTNGADYNFGTTRFNSNGMVDNTFGTAGIVNTSLGSGDDDPYGLVVQRDGKILVAGASFNGANFDFASVRYLANGSMDNTYGNAGKVITSLGSGSDYCNAILLQADNKVVLAGYSANGINDDVALLRYSNVLLGITKNNSSQNDWIIYPNPGEGVLQLKNITSFRVDKVEVYNALGELVLIENTVGDTCMQIDLAKQPKGIYWIRVYTQNPISCLRYQLF